MHIRITGKVVIHAKTEQAKEFMLNINNIGNYEPKVNSILTTSKSNSAGTYTSHGKFLGLPWSGTFSYSINPDGFHSEMTEGMLANNMNGGFIIIESGNNTCIIKHYENYQFPKWALILKPILKIYLQTAMREELKNISKLISAEYELSVKSKPHEVIIEAN